MGPLKRIEAPVWWEECGTPEAEARLRCPPCWRGEEHPWHHSYGMPINAEDIEAWLPGGEHAPPTH